MTDNEFDIKNLTDDSRLIRTGEVLDNSNADRFSSLIMDLYSAEVKYVLIDMAELEFLSSAGIGSILGQVGLFRERGGDIILSNVGTKIMHILDVLNLVDYLTICESTEEATARCGI
jgi:anti-anti-sigma factor